jgi:hypothetical protein
MLQVFVRTDVAALTGPYESDPVVQQLLQWTSTSDVRKSIVKKFTVGGRYSYPPVSRDVSAYVSSFPAEKPIQVPDEMTIRCLSVYVVVD